MAKDSHPCSDLDSKTGDQMVTRRDVPALMVNRTLKGRYHTGESQRPSICLTTVPPTGQTKAYLPNASRPGCSHSRTVSVIEGNWVVKIPITGPTRKPESLSQNSAPRRPGLVLAI